MSNLEPTSPDLAALAANLPGAPDAADPNAALNVAPEPDTSLEAIPVDLKAWLDRNAPLVMGDAPAEGQSAVPAGTGETSPASASVASDAEGTTTAEPSAPVPGDTPPPAEPEPDPELPTAATLKVAYGGAELEINAEQAQELVATYAWVTDPNRQQLFQVTAAIEAGQAVALARADYDALIAAAQRAQAPAPAATPQLPTIPKVDPNQSLDPDLARAFNALADMVQAQQATTAAQPAAPAQDAPAPAPLFDPVAAQQQAELEQRRNAIDQIHQTYAQRYGLTELEAQRLMEVAARSGDVARELQAHNARSPHLPFNMEAAVSVAFDRALVSDPSLRARYEAALRSNNAAPAAPAGTPSAAPATAAKKANAGTLSSLSSAATPAPNRDPRQMSDQDVQAAIAAELQAALSR